MKNTPIDAIRNPNKRIRLLITQEQFRKLASTIIEEQDNKAIKMRYLETGLKHDKKKSK